MGEWSSRSRTFEVLLVLCAALQVYVLKTGRFGFEGVLLNPSPAYAEVASPWALLSSWMCVTLAPSCAFVMAARRRLSPVMIVCFLWNMGLAMLMGRRNFLTAVFLSTLPLFIFPFNKRARASMIAVGLAGGAAAMVLFFALRLSMGENNLERTDLHGLWSGALNLFTESRSSGYAKRELLANTTTRTFNIGYMSLIAKNARVFGGANGLILKYSAMGILPGFLYPQKHMLTLMGGEEGIAMKVLRIETSPDDNNSTITAAMTDFGYLGVPIYACITFVVIALAILLIRQTRGSELGLLALFHLFFTVAYIEAAFDTIFIALRLMAVLCVIGMIVIRVQRRGGALVETVNGGKIDEEQTSA